MGMQVVQYEKLDNIKHLLIGAIDGEIGSGSIGFYLVKPFEVLTDERRDALIKKIDEYTRTGEAVYDKKALADHKSPVLLFVAPNNFEEDGRNFLSYMSDFSIGLSGWFYKNVTEDTSSSLDKDLEKATADFDRVNLEEIISFFELL